MLLRYIYSFLLIFILSSQVVKASEPQNQSKEEKFNLVEFALHHISDSYYWDFYTTQSGEKVRLPLPRILWDKQQHKLSFYLTTAEAWKHGWVRELDYNTEALEGGLLIPGSAPEAEKLKEKFLDKSDTTLLKVKQDELSKSLSNYKPLDFSITKNVLFIIFISILMLWIFISIARKYTKNPVSAPKGIQSFFEPVIVFIRDDIAKQNIPHDYERYMPLLLNLFFFIAFLNLSGIIPFSANVTGNIAVTASLAVITLIVTNVSGKKNYWQHVFWFPGVPVFIKPIMLIVELVGVFTKPFALTIRLFANMTAGHMVALCFVSLIFIFSDLGRLPALGYTTSFFSVLFVLFTDCIELFIAVLQAYIFTLLSAVFIGQALEENH